MAQASTRPYLLRAMHEWMSDNGMTPHVVVDATVEGVAVPAEHVADGKIVLNISLSATRNLMLGNDDVQFEARFSGAARQLYVPIEAVLGIYARETGQGMIFAESGQDGGDAAAPAGPRAADDAAASEDPARPEDGAVDPSEPSDPTAPSRPPRKPGGSRPSLKVVK
jgi:stringent starvation protein B